MIETKGYRMKEAINEKDYAFNEFVTLAVDLIGGDYNNARRYADKLWDMASCFGDINTVSNLQDIADDWERCADMYLHNILNARSELASVCKGRKMVQVKDIMCVCDCYLDV